MPSHLCGFIQGPPGVDGVIGTTGKTGADGNTGPKGHKGVRGPPGNQGTEGARGPAGPAGPKGNKVLIFLINASVDLLFYLFECCSVVHCVICFILIRDHQDTLVYLERQELMEMMYVRSWDV